MSIYAAPSASFEATSDGFPTGLTGTLAVRIVDGQGVTVTARSTSGVSEYPAASGIYTVTKTAPATPGQYQIIWDTGGTDVSWAVEDITVQVPSPAPLPYVVTGARTGMADLIGTVRGLTGAGTAEYTVGATSYFADGHLQDILDRSRIDVEYVPMIPVATYAAGSVSYRRYMAPIGNLEAGTAISVHDAGGSVIGTALWSADYLRGEFTFTTDQQGETRYLTGRAYDPHAAAAEALEMWATAESRAFDFSTDGQSFARSQKAQGLREQAKALRKRARIGIRRMRTGR